MPHVAQHISKETLPSHHAVFVSCITSVQASAAASPSPGPRGLATQHHHLRNCPHSTLVTTHGKQEAGQLVATKTFFT